ncbi:hypothetical protein C8F01DRAFT_1377202 [Mycena amicta]|nr:hypothetical protein C8F01DRAFT_1377202 [Mycena amicta]
MPSVNRVTRRDGPENFLFCSPMSTPPSPSLIRRRKPLWPSSSRSSRSQGIQAPMFKSTPQAPHIKASVDAQSLHRCSKTPKPPSTLSMLGQRSSKNPHRQPQALTPPAARHPRHSR